MARITWHDHADHLLGGDLDKILARWRDDDGLTIDQISRRLSDDHQLDVSRETVRRWLMEVPSPSPENAA